MRFFLIFTTLILGTVKLNIDDNLSSFVTKYFTIFLIIFLASLSFLLYDLFALVKQKNDKKFRFSNENKAFVNKIQKLSYEEKIFLLYL